VPTVITVSTLALLLASLLVVHFARREAAAIRLSAEAELHDLRAEGRQITADAQRREERVVVREKELVADQRTAADYARSLEERASVLAREERQLSAQRDSLLDKETAALGKVAAMSPGDAKKALIDTLTKQATADAAGELRRIEKKLALDAEARAKEVLVEAMQRQVGPTTSQTAVTWVTLPSEEMKGRIIGREGRNIRAFEAITGVNAIIEEGVNAVMLSSFDVERREVAEVTLAALVADGRIQPQRVEAAYAAALEGTSQRHVEAGLDAAEAVGLRGVPPEIVEALGRLRLRSSYGQSVLGHLVESAQMARAIAKAIGADAELAARATFFHDIGKAYTHDREGTHAAIGAQIAAAAGESPEVVNAIAAHHDEVPQETLEAVIVQVADAMSASRPGARREDYEGYVERLESLEKLVKEHAGVSKAVAMAAGREVRVIVEPDEVDDEGARELARTIARHIENDLSYPGEIKVTVIRELRADAIAG